MDGSNGLRDLERIVEEGEEDLRAAAVGCGEGCGGELALRAVASGRGCARLLALGMLLALGACAPLPQRAGVPTRWEPSPNFDARRPNFVIVHHTSNDTTEQALRTLTDQTRKVSAHYLIGRDGTIWQLVDERARAWHAGQSFWGGSTDLNSASLGIELDNTGDEPYPQAQVDALVALLEDVRQRLGIPAANVLGHGDVAPRRKTDPGRLFPWRTLAHRGFGLWCDPPWPDTANAMDPLLGLRALGYDISDPQAAIAAFRRHYRPQDMGLVLTASDAGLIRCLLEQEMPAGQGN